MWKPPLPETAVAMLRMPNPAVITTLRRDGQPISTATWYQWDEGRVLVNMDEGRKRLVHMRHDPRLRSTCSMKVTGTPTSASPATSTSGARTPTWPTSKLARHYTGHPYPQRDRGRISAWIAVEGWHGWGALKDNSNQPG